MWVARGNIEAAPDDHRASTPFLGWAGKCQANRRLIGLRSTRSVVMNLNDDIGSLWNKPGIFRCWRLCHRAGNPSADQVDAGNSGSTETRIAAVIASTPSGGSRRIDKYQRMMHDASVARPELCTADVDVMIKIHRQQKTPELVVAAGRHSETRWDSEDLIGLPCLPAIAERGDWRLIIGIALRGAVVSPGPDQSNLIVR